jgi:hypothetical protein
MNYKFVLLAVFVLLLIVTPALAQDEDTTVVTANEGGDITLPDWASQLAIGTVSLSSFVWLGTEIIKTVLKLLGVYKDGYGRPVFVVLAIGFTALLLVSQTFEVEGLVTPRMEWVYQVMLLISSILGAPVVHQVAKFVGIKDNKVYG